jgi:hypothetical protein
MRLSDACMKPVTPAGGIARLDECARAALLRVRSSASLGTMRDISRATPIPAQWVGNRALHITTGFLILNLWSFALGRRHARALRPHKGRPLSSGQAKFWASYVAVMLHGAAVTILQPLKIKGNMLQYVAGRTWSMGKIKASQVLELTG